MQMLAGAIKLQTRVPGGSFGRNKGQQTGNYGGLRKLDKPDSNRTSPFCNYCKKTGHSIDKCYRLHGFPPNFKFTKGRKMVATIQHPTESAHAASDQIFSMVVPRLSQEQSNQLMSLLHHIQLSKGSEGSHSHS